MRLEYFSSIRVRLLLLVFLALVPILGLMLFSYGDQKKQAILNGQDSALRIARLAAKDQDYLFEGARQLLVVMSQLPSVQNHDAVECQRFLADLLKQFPVYENLGAASSNGDIFCSAVPLAPNINLEDRAWFIRTIKTRSFVAGDYIIARISGRPALTNAYPIFDEHNQLTTVVFAGIDLKWLDKFIADARLSEGTSLAVVDQSGTILTRYPDAETWRGKSIPPSTMEYLLDQNQGVMDTDQLDGSAILYGFTRLCCTPWNNIYIVVGITKADALSEANQNLVSNLTIFGIVILMSFIVARSGAKIFILRPLNTLLTAINRFDIGDFGFRIGKTSGGKELDQVAHALNQMATAVEAREAERNRTEEMLRIQSVRAQSLTTTTARLNAHLDLQELLGIICQESARALLVPAASVSFYDDTHNVLGCVSCSGLPDDCCTRMDALSQGASILDLKNGDAICIPNIQSLANPDLISWLDRLKINAVTFNPLIHEGKLIGALCVLFEEVGHCFTDGELTFLKAMSDQAAQAIVNARLYQALREEQLSRAALLGKTITAQEDERKRIARELHDQTSQDLAALMFSLDASMMGLAINGPGIEQHLQIAKSLVSTILTNINHLMNDLRPSLLDDLGLASAILWYGEKRLKPVGIELDFQCNQMDTRLPPPVETALFRTVQEALTNIVRHAKATRVKVILDMGGETVSLRVEDNGVGFEVASVVPEQPDGRGLGLRGMQERVMTLGGELQISSTSGQGTIIEIRVP